MILNEGLKVGDAPEDAKAGMKGIEVVQLGVGENLYRFTSRSVPVSLQGASPWWVRQPDFQTFVREWAKDKQELRARNPAAEVSIGFSARLALAVQQSWGNTMDMIVQARVTQDMCVFRGQPRTQYRDQAPNGMTITLRGSPNVRQLYIPEVGAVGGARKGAMPSGIRVVRSVGVNSFQFW
jgi:hypothetical protein